eukprot:29828-Pelagococcus_subviridis.AAC.4
MTTAPPNLSGGGGWWYSGGSAASSALRCRFSSFLLSLRSGLFPSFVAPLARDDRLPLVSGSTSLGNAGSALISFGGLLAHAPILRDDRRVRTADAPVGSDGASALRGG